MAYGREFKRLGAYLDEHLEVPLDARRIGVLLAECWDALDGSADTNMRAQKLWRIEQPLWNPPTFEFSIERHGETVNGSSRATVYRWSVDLEKGTARIIDEKRRQVYQMDKRLDVKPIAESLADAIIGGKEDGRIVVNKDGSVRLKIGEIIPETNSQTTSARRTRLRNQLSKNLAPHGWKELRTNVYHQPDAAAEDERTK
jgi:hypothetical protein